MKMSIAILLSFIAICSTSAWAQNFVEIGGTLFQVDLDNRSMTATIVDYNHEIDDAKYPIKGGNRKLRYGGNNFVLQVPEKVKVNGREYTITSIGYAAFADYKNFSYVQLPSSLVSIGDYAFFRTNLIDVTIPDGVLSIGNRAFGHCTKLRRLTMPSNVALGDRVYAEVEKKIHINRYGGAADSGVSLASNGSSNSPRTGMARSQWVKSDIDVDIPNANGVASNTFAVIIANENYESDPKVDYAIQDGETFKTYCEQTLGIPSNHIKMKLDASYNNIRTLVNWVADVTELYDGKARVIFYYSGHGSQGADGITSLLPVDGSANDEASGYSLKTLYGQLGAMPVQDVCVFLDACFSGKQRNDELIVAARGARRAVEEAPLGNMVVFSAAQDKETAFAYPEKGHGMFTYYLLKKLKESRGTTTLGDLADYINESVARSSRLTMNAKQTPNTSTSAAMASRWRKLTLNN